MKKVEVKVQRNYSREITSVVEVPQHLQGIELREYLIDKYDGSDKVEYEFNRVPLECDNTILQDVIEVEQEFKIKWEIELTASSPEDAAKLALEIIQSKDSSANVFNVDGENIDLEEEEVFVAKIIDPNKTTKEEDVIINFVNDRLRPFGIQTKREVCVYNSINGILDLRWGSYRLLVFNNRGQWDMEECEDLEITRGEYDGYFYIVDKLTK